VDVMDAVEAEGEIVGERIRDKKVRGGKVFDQRVVGKEEEKRGEGASLLDTPKDVNPDVRTRPEEGRPYLVDSSLDKVDEPLRKLHFLNDSKDPSVVNRVEGLGRVKKEDEALFTVDHGLVEPKIEVFNVVCALDGRKEPILRLMRFLTDFMIESAITLAGSYIRVSTEASCPRGGWSFWV